MKRHSKRIGATILLLVGVVVQAASACERDGQHFAEGALVGGVVCVDGTWVSRDAPPPEKSRQTTASTANGGDDSSTGDQTEE